MEKDSIDLMNVEYDDVLHLYRGWRKSETALKDKDKELIMLKNRVKQLQESHVKFRSQIQALESVKDMTVKLQNELISTQHENSQLLAENKELAELNLRADELLRGKDLREDKQAKIIKDLHIQLANLQGRYEETIKTQRELEVLAADEQAMRLAAEARLKSADETIEELNEDRRNLQQKVETTEMKLNQCDHELSHASEQLGALTQEINQINLTKNELFSKEAETNVLRGDIARLISLLEFCPATKEFIDEWKDSGGIDFMGIDRTQHDHSHNHSHSGGHGHSLLEISESMEESKGPKGIMSSFNLTPAEFAHLKRLHGEDPFPMTSNLSEEVEYWVPSEAARLGLHFLSEKIPHASPKVIVDFLRSMNKIWLRRERRKVKRIKAVLGGTIEDLKRQISQSRPYKGVLAERQIRRLRSQVRDSRSKQLHGRPKSYLEIDNSKFLTEDQLIDEFPSPLRERRYCKIMKKKQGKGPAGLEVVSAEKLLEASLVSLETMGRQLQLNTSSPQKGRGASKLGYSGVYEGNNSFAASVAMGNESMIGGQKYPNESYLRGALWLGRNLTIISEELMEHFDNFRRQHLSELSSINNDNEQENQTENINALRRTAHRLALLASSAMSKTYTLVQKSNKRTRDILEGAAGISPGDARAFEQFLQNLPIESTLTNAANASANRYNATEPAIELEEGSYLSY